MYNLLKLDPPPSPSFFPHNQHIGNNICFYFDESQSLDSKSFFKCKNLFRLTNITYDHVCKYVKTAPLFFVLLEYNKYQ